jgi:murein L,D-transpeptidase YcbB/YkuD
VKRFQRLHGLETDGIIGPATLAAMNVTAPMRVRQIIANMESWRWVARDPGERMLVVNIPNFELKCLRREKPELSMSVIVGEQYHMTPVFTDKVRFVEINPYWDIPRKIAANEMLPKLKLDPLFLNKQHIRMFEGAAGENEVDSTTVDWSTFSPADMDRYHLRQDFGPDNALGLLAFMFPNQFAVYLHDTPAKTLFDLPRRAFSHGCIRVAKAMDLAVYLLGGPDKGWGPDEITQAIGEGNNRIIHLERPVPVYIMYNTAVADPETHEIFFFEDVYGRDVLLEKALFD